MGGSNGATRAPRLGVTLRMPCACRSLIASRIGTRLTPSWRARSSSLMRASGSSVPCATASTIASATTSPSWRASWARPPIGRSATRRTSELRAPLGFAAVAALYLRNASSPLTGNPASTLRQGSRIVYRYASCYGASRCIPAEPANGRKTMQRRHFFASAALTALLALGLTTSHAQADATDVPAPGKSKKIDAIKTRGALKAAAIGEFPWLPENTSGTGDKFSGPAWVLANEYAKRLGVKLEIVPVSHETKIPILATGEADISIAPLSVTPQRQQVVDFIVYSKSSLCFFGLASNPKLQAAKSVDDLNSPNITMAYFTGTPPETWAPTRFPKATLKGVAGSGANAPVEEILAKRADVAPIDNVAWPDLSKKVPGDRKS